VDQARHGTVSRTTKETSISVAVKLDGGLSGTHVSSGIKTLDTFFLVLAQHAEASLELSCHGDLYIDEHHTAEDVSIAFGQCLVEALGTKAGLNRMWCSTKEHGSARVQVVMDLSNRPCLTHNLSLARDDEEMVGDLSLEMFDHALDSLVANARMTVHIVELASGSLDDLVVATAMAFGDALKYCSMVDLRRCGATASSKGTLSV
jgi:imidazoleglycerol-phosphate dehydratase